MKSNVTEYILNYMKKQNLDGSVVAGQTGIYEEKLLPGYKEPLLADEFLKLCVFLHLSPEKIINELYHK